MPQPVEIGIRALFAVFALVMFVLAGLGLPNHPRFQYGWWGLAFLTLAFFVSVQLH